jgi:hypothetical protein
MFLFEFRLWAVFLNTVAACCLAELTGNRDIFNTRWPTKQITYILFVYYLQHPCFSHCPLSGSIEQEIRDGGGGVGEREKHNYTNKRNIRVYAYIRHKKEIGFSTDRTDRQYRQYLFTRWSFLF